MYRTVYRALDFPSDWYWIGLKEQTNIWIWANGQRASTVDETMWWPGRPNVNMNYNCGASLFNRTHMNGLLVHDWLCSNVRRSICEKLI